MNNTTLIITHVNAESNHIVALDIKSKKACGLYVADPKDCLGQSFTISAGSAKHEVECAAKFYNTYKISEVSPYESEWNYVEIDTNSTVFQGPVPFIPIPMSTAEKKSLRLSQVQIGSTWSDGKRTWCVKDKCVETLAGMKRERVWITDTSGKHGQAIYANSLIDKYELQSSPQ